MTTRKTTPQAAIQLGLIAFALACSPPGDEVGDAESNSGDADHNRSSGAPPSGTSSSGAGNDDMDPVRSLRAVVSDDGRRIIVDFPQDVSDVRPVDFKILGTHAKLDESQPPVLSGAHVELWLDEAVYPDDPLELDYFAPSGTLAAPRVGRRVDSFRVAVQNDDSEYHGGRRVVRLEGGENIDHEIESNSLILLKRGDRFDESVDVEVDDVVVSAYGEGPAPELAGTRGSYVIAVYANDFRVANLSIIATDQVGISLKGDSSFALISSNWLRGEQAQGRKGIFLFQGTSRVKNKWPEGNWALNNVITGFEDGIKSRLEPASWDSRSPDFVPWDRRELGGNHAPFLVELNTIEGKQLGGAEGDGIGMSRGGYFGSKIRRNTILGWADDGIDNFGAREVIVEYNYLRNELDMVNPSGSGNGIKMGGEGGGQGQDDRTGNNVYRYNTVLGTVGKRPSGEVSGTGHGMLANRGSNQVGVTNIYGNVVVGTTDAPLFNDALFIDGSDGSFWRVYNNLFVGSGMKSQGIREYQAYNLSSLDLRNNIYNTSSFLVPDSNFEVSALGAIFTDPGAPHQSMILADSPTVNAGSGEGPERDRFGFSIDGLDIGPTEYVASRDREFIQWAP